VSSECKGGGRGGGLVIGTSPEYYDSKMVARGEGRAVTRVVSDDRAVKVNLMVIVKDLPTFGYASSAP
jgi:hypothetical protein